MGDAARIRFIGRGSRRVTNGWFVERRSSFCLFRSSNGQGRIEQDPNRRKYCIFPIRLIHQYYLQEGQSKVSKSSHSFSFALVESRRICLTYSKQVANLRKWRYLTYMNKLRKLTQAENVSGGANRHYVRNAIDSTSTPT